ncbi:MAG: site-specific DNA-methyltransferase [Gammaproteobacteria bacterium]|nr:site-specific DNA-methyltransferase [Gammaproteobacteria bacterium]
MNESDQTTIDLETPSQPMVRLEDYQFEPIKGYPMLNWRGKRPFTSTQFYPAQLKEMHGEEVDGWRNKIYWGDNLQVMRHLLKEFRGKVDLIYIDPPFDSRADYRKKIKIPSKGGAVYNNNSAFEEKQYSDIWTNDEYLQYMYERIVLLRELLSSRGSLYLHCDWHKGHQLRCLLDEVFGPDNFVNENIWKRTTAHGDAKQGAQRFDIVHDTILLYTKTKDYLWNSQYVPFGEAQIAQQYNRVDDDGRRYRLVTPTASKPGGDTSYEFHGVKPPPGRFWAYKMDTMEKMYKEKKLYFSSTGQPYIKYYLDDRPGVAVSTLWTDVPILSPTAHERENYPTQKPEALLERIVKTSSPSGGLVLDCFMGSGTTQAVSLKLGRRFIGADINLGAVHITAKRLTKTARELSQKDQGNGEKPFTGFEIYTVNNYDIFRNPAQAKDLLLDALEVNRLELGSVFDGERDGRMVKIMPINRIATRADLNELISGLDYKAFERRQTEKPTHPVERITLVCMGHEPDLKAQLEHAAKPYKIDVEVVDILRDKAELEFKRDAEARVEIQDGDLLIERFYPMNLLQKLSLQKEKVDEWRELVESVMVDWNYDGVVLQPTVVDIPDKDELVVGRYAIPEDAGTIRVKITDLLSESWEGSINYG